MTCRIRSFELKTSGKQLFFRRIFLLEILSVLVIGTVAGDEFYHSPAGCPLYNVNRSDYPAVIHDLTASGLRAGVTFEIDGCSVMYSMYCGANVSYVANCKLKHAIEPALLCNASTTNAFAISSKYSSEVLDMAKFVEGHCVGG